MSLTREQFHQHVKHLIDRSDLHVTSAFALEDHDAAQRVEIARLTHQLQQKTLLEQSVGLDAAWEVAKANEQENVRLHAEVVKQQAEIERLCDLVGAYEGGMLHDHVVALDQKCQRLEASLAACRAELQALKEGV